MSGGEEHVLNFVTYPVSFLLAPPPPPLLLLHNKSPDVSPRSILMFKIVPKKSLVLPQLSGLYVNGFFSRCPNDLFACRNKQAGAHQQFKCRDKCFIFNFQKSTTKKLGEDQPLEFIKADTSGLLLCNSNF